MPNSDSDDKTQSHVLLASGTMVSHYRIIEKIGAGGMGEVYLAEDTELKRKVALKFLSLHLCQDPECRARFKREAQAAAKLNHPNIVTIHEVSEFNGWPYFAMEYLEGQSLRELIKQKEMPLSQTIQIAIQLCEGLQEAHAKGVIHRDIKPANITCDSKGHCKILDFGLAAVRGSEHLTKTGSTLGTVGYMSPEQAKGESADARSDLFSLGVVLYEMIAGRSPFKAESEAVTVKNVIEAVPEPLARYKSGVSDDLQRIVDKALSKDRALRYQHADELAADLKRLISIVGPAPRPSRGKRKVVVPSLIVIGAVIAALVFKPWRVMMQPLESAPTAAKRVVVVPFRNQTGDPSLDALGRMVADWTTQSLLQTGLAEVVPPEELLQLNADKGIHSIAKITGAGMIVTGSFYKIGDSLQCQAQISAADEKLLQAIEPIYFRATKVMDGVESMRQRILGALAVLLDERLTSAVQGTRPPTYAAYQEYIQGAISHYSSREWASAEKHYRQAFAIDTSFLDPLLRACAMDLNQLKFAVCDSLVRFLNGRRTRLTVLQQLDLDLNAALLSGDWMKGLECARKAASLAPGSQANYKLAYLALGVNRPSEAIEALKNMDPDLGWAKDWTPYWICFANAYHILGDFAQELDVAQKGRRRFPRDISLLNCQIRALIALGKIDDIKVLFIEGEMLRRGDGAPGSISGMEFAAAELRAHGHEPEAMALSNQVVQWYRSRPANQLRGFRLDCAVALYNARQWKEAKSIIEELDSENPDPPWGSGYKGWIGCIAARQGDLLEAQKASDWLSSSTRPYSRGRNRYVRASIAAILGDKEQAMTLLKDSFLEGDNFFMDLHRDFDFELLRDYPPFIELKKPKG